ncbi:MAG: hypothetical protein KatS3mg042_1419 [Rhodothermaceae bacterium]|nr:MAG: hypothetical protein KatS3mg042_1419 [Rhodothermaceae bacterium]
MVPTAGLPRGRAGWGWVLALTGCLVPVMLATLPPFVGESARSFLMALFAPVCHQIPTRSPHLEGVALAVCHRCYGIYWGLVGGVLLFIRLRRVDAWLYRHAPRVLGAALLPSAMDWSAGFLGIWTNTPGSRFLTGLLFGCVAGYFVARGCVEAMTRTHRQRQPGTLRSAAGKRALESPEP